MQLNLQWNPDIYILKLRYDFDVQPGWRITLDEWQGVKWRGGVEDHGIHEGTPNLVWRPDTDDFLEDVNWSRDLKDENQVAKRKHCKENSTFENPKDLCCA